MSRILIHSNAPWVPSGYGKQAQHLIRTLQTLGHEVVVSAFSGLGGAPIEWHGVTVLPGGMYEYGIDVLLPHIDAVQPDLTIALMDVWKLGPIVEGLAKYNVAAWTPVDSYPLSKLDEAFFKTSSVKPLSMSLFGQRRFEEAGLTALYAPHVVDRNVFKPLDPDVRRDYREALRMEGRFVIGMCAANNDATRKGFPETFEAFRRFHKKHQEALLVVHSVANNARGLQLQRTALEMGVDSTSIRFQDTYAQISGAFDDSLMADWYGVLDVLSSCSYAEAFGVPLIEAQACGTPVIGTRGSAMAEHCEPGWTVEGDPYWNPVHHAWWTRPRMDAMVRTYEKALALAGRRRGEAHMFTERFDAAITAEQHWKGILEELLA